MNTTFTVSDEQANQTLAKLLREQFPGHSWSKVRQWVEKRRAIINGDVCLDSGRRMQSGDVVELREHSLQKPKSQDELVIRHLDEHVVVVEKPSGTPTVRHPAERAWSERRRALTPTLDDLVVRKIDKIDRQSRQSQSSRLRVVQRLDKHTSGLVVFARNVAAERHLGMQFQEHTVLRRYWAVVPGQVTNQTIRSRLVRDRGDGKRGSTSLPNMGKEAITHVDVDERLTGYTVLSCRLETGRTHQIRIHLAELGHPVCGDKVYCQGNDDSGAPRLVLHAAELGFVHPTTQETMSWAMELPRDLQFFLQRIRG